MGLGGIFAAPQMTELYHALKFNEGSIAWNEWRRHNAKTVPILEGGDLVWNEDRAPDGSPVPYDLSNVKLRNVEVKVGVSGANFFKSSLEHVRFLDNVSGAKFNRANLENVAFNGIGLHKSRFDSATLADCSFEDAWFSPSPPGDDRGLLARLRRRGKKLIEAIGRSDENSAETPVEGGFENAKAVDCSFRGAAFADIPLKRAQFINCDLRETRGLVLDENLLRGTVFSPNCKDDWSVLRRAYTGANMIFIMIASTIFFLPWIFDLFYWTGLSQAEVKLSEASKQLQSDLDEMPMRPETRAAWMGVLDRISDPEAEACVLGAPDEPDARDAPKALGEPGEPHDKDAPPATCFPIWKVLLGWHEGGFAGFVGVFLIVYNVLRLGMTWFIAPMRDEEERSHQSPPRALPRRWPGARRLISAWRSHYGWLVVPHWFVSKAFFVVLFLGVANLLPRMFERVWVFQAVT